MDAAALHHLARFSHFTGAARRPHCQERKHGQRNTFSPDTQVLQCRRQARKTGDAVPDWLCWGAASQNKSKRRGQKAAIPQPESREKEEKSAEGWNPPVQVSWLSGEHEPA